MDNYGTCPKIAQLRIGQLKYIPCNRVVRANFIQFLSYDKLYTIKPYTVYYSELNFLSSSWTWKIISMFHFLVSPPSDQTKTSVLAKSPTVTISPCEKLHINTCDCQTFCLCRLWSFLSLFSFSCFYMKNVLRRPSKKKPMGDKQCYNDK